MWFDWDHLDSFGIAIGLASAEWDPKGSFSFPREFSGGLGILSVQMEHAYDVGWHINFPGVLKAAAQWLAQGQGDGGQLKQFGGALLGAVENA